MVHNLAPHDLNVGRRQAWKLYLAALVRLLDGFVTLSPATVPAVLDEIPALKRVPHDFVWHPSYPKQASVAERGSTRLRLRIAEGATVLGCVGLLRPYKGLEELVVAFREANSLDRHLLLAGMPSSPAYGERLVELAGGDRRISFVEQDLTDEEYASLLSALDVFVVPFRESLHSGSLVHALSEHRPVLTPLSPFAFSLQETVGRGWVQTYTGALTPALLCAVSRPSGEPDLTQLSPQMVGERMTSFYRRLIASCP